MLIGLFYPLKTFRPNFTAILCGTTTSCIFRISDSETLAKCEFVPMILYFLGSCIIYLVYSVCGRHGGLMVSALDSGASSPSLSPGRGHCVVFLGKRLYSHSASLYPGV